MIYKWSDYVKWSDVPPEKSIDGQQKVIKHSQNKRRRTKNNNFSKSEIDNDINV